MNLRPAAGDQPEDASQGPAMTLLPAIGLLYLAYRIIRNGFLSPQSERLNGFGVFACVLLFIMAVTYVSQYF